MRFIRQTRTRTVVAQRWNTPATTSCPQQRHVHNVIRLHNDRGSDGALVCAAPTSEPCKRISRLSSRWFYLMRIGINMTGTQKAHMRICLKGLGSWSTDVLGQSVPRPLSLVMDEFPTAGIRMGKGTENSSPWLSPYGHSRGLKPHPHTITASTFLHPLAPRALPRFFATMDALTPARGALRTQHKRIEHPPWPGQVSPVHMTRTSLHSVTNHPTRPVIAFPLPTQRDRLPEPGLRPAVPMPCRGLANLWQTSCLRPRPGLDFTINEEARRYVRPNRVRFTTDCKFASGCSPPRLATTQLPSAIGSGHLPGEDLHLSDRACSQAHSFPRRRQSRKGDRAWADTFNKGERAWKRR